MKDKKLVIIGNTSNAKLAHHYFTSDSDYSVEAFCVHQEYIKESEFCGLSVYPVETILEQFPPEKFDLFVAVGYTDMNNIRKQLFDDLKGKGYYFPNYISSKCSFLTDNKIGQNNFILEDNTIQPFVEIGDNNVLWSGNHIGHDVRIHNHCFITSHVVISGFTIIEDNSFLGVNCSLRDDIIVRSYSLIGAGACIMKDTDTQGVYLAPAPTKLSKGSLEIKIS